MLESCTVFIMYEPNIFASVGKAGED